MEYMDDLNIVPSEPGSWEVGDRDSVSLEETVTSFSQQNSTVTQLLEHSETETEFNGSTTLDANIEEFLRSQFPDSTSDENENQGDSSNVNASTVNSAINVAEWLKKAEEDGATVSNSGERVTDDENGETAESVEKVAAVLSDAIMNDEFKPEGWVETKDDVGIVPNGNWKEIIIQEIQQRQPLALMNIINACCSTSSSPQRYRYTEILELAAANMRDAFGKAQPGGASTSTTKPKEMTLSQLRLSNGAEYYSNMKFQFKKVPKSKQPVVRTVQKFVTKSINDAFESGHSVLFTGYALIPKVVEDSNNKYELNLSAEQKAKIGLLLQQAVYQEMVDRCLNFLAHVGYELRVEKLQIAEDDKENQVIFCREPASLSSSQGSQAESMVSASSEGSSMSVRENSQSSLDSNELPIPPPLDPEVHEAVQNSPGVEFLRADGDGSQNSNSPGGSMGSGSYRSYDSYSLSLPDPDPYEYHNHILFEPSDHNGIGSSLENTNVFLNLSPVRNSSQVSSASNSIGSEAGSHDEGPQRRRRRLN